MLIGITYDLRDDYLKMGFTEEETAEFDRVSTIDAIDSALSRLGHETDRIGNLLELTRRLVAGQRWDLVFNIAEGMYGTGREAQVPALLDAYRIPYTFSDPLVLSLTLHKGMTKDVVREAGIPTPAYALPSAPEHVPLLLDLLAQGSLPPADPRPLPFPVRGRLQFPLFAKPNAEGTGKGIDARSVIRTPEELRNTCLDLLSRFRQPVLVETYLPGREFTVGIVGTGTAARIIGTMEVKLRPEAECGSYSYLNKDDWQRRVDYVLAEDDEGTTAARHALEVWRTLGCRDAGRVDLRSDENGVPGFVEVNPLAGIRPDYSDLPILCNLVGLPYIELIRSIIHSACSRIPEVAAVPSPRPAADAKPTEDARVAVVLLGEIPPHAPEDEQDTLAEAEVMCGALRELGYRTERVFLTPNLLDADVQLRALAPHVVCNITETVSGRMQYIHLAPALLDALGIPYTGARMDAQYATSNKVLGKKVLRGAGISTPDWVDEGRKPGFPPPYIVKSVWEHASVGLTDDSIVADPSLLPPIVACRKERYGGQWFVEQYVDGREFNVALVTRGAGKTPQVLPPAEIRFVGFAEGRPRFVGYSAKWDESSFEYHNTPRTFDLPQSDSELLERLKSCALQCWDVFQLTGYARVDFRVSADGSPYVLEVNVNPCVSPDSGFYAMLQQAAIDLPEFMRRIVTEALELG